LIGSFLVSDFRKWRATRTVKLTIYQRGFIYESEGSGETCRWDEIKDLNYKVIEIRSKHSLPSKVRVVRSILKRDDKLITLAETLDLIKITPLITSAQKHR
jgi:hypothetical protein